MIKLVFKSVRAAESDEVAWCFDKNIIDKKMEQRFPNHRIPLFVTNVFVKYCFVHLVRKILIRKDTIGDRLVSGV